MATLSGDNVLPSINPGPSHTPHPHSEATNVTRPVNVVTEGGSSSFTSTAIATTTNLPDTSTTISPSPLETESSSHNTTSNDTVMASSSNQSRTVPVVPIVIGCVVGLVLLVGFVLWYRRAARKRRRVASGASEDGSGGQELPTHPIQQDVPQEPATGTRLSMASKEKPRSSSNAERSSRDSPDKFIDPLGVGKWRRVSVDVEKLAADGKGLQTGHVSGLSNDSRTRLSLPLTDPSTQPVHRIRHSLAIMPNGSGGLNESDRDPGPSRMMRSHSLQIIPTFSALSSTNNSPHPRSQYSPLPPLQTPTPKSSQGSTDIPTSPQLQSPTAAGTLSPDAALPHDKSLPPLPSDAPSSTRESLASGASSLRSGVFSLTSVRTADLFFAPGQGGTVTPGRMSLQLAGGGSSSRPSSARQASNGGGVSRSVSRAGIETPVSAVAASSVVRRGSDSSTPSSGSAERARNSRGSSAGMHQTSTGMAYAVSTSLPETGALSMSSGSSTNGWLSGPATLHLGESSRTLVLSDSPLSSQPTLQLQRSLSESRLRSATTAASELGAVGGSTPNDSSSGLQSSSSSSDPQPFQVSNSGSGARPDPIVEEEAMTPVLPDSANPLIRRDPADLEVRGRWSSRDRS